MPDRAARRTPAAVALAAAFWLCLLAVLALWTALQPTVARAEEPSGDIITVLQPGENLVGWIAAEAPVGDLFAAVPEIEAVWAWDTRRGRWRVASPRVPETFHSLRTLTPGMGLLIQLGGDQPVEWTRSAVPARGLVQLRPGPNLVAWAGPDDSEITWLGKGIGISLVSAGLPSSGETGWSLYDPTDAATAETFPAVNRGDALWVTSSRNINWLQPTGVLPKLEFPGGASRQLREEVRADLRSVLEFYADLYAIQADFAHLTVYVPKDLESLNAVDGQSVTSEFWETGAGGWAGLNSFVVKRHGAPGLGPDDGTRPTLSHEYFHVMQSHFLGVEDGFINFNLVPNWLIEGTATYMQWRHGDVQGFDGLGRFDFTQRRRTLRSNRASLESSAQPYSHGLIASDLLAQRAGGEALIEFWRLLGPSSRTPWQEAFREAFQVSETDFYSVFCRFRRGETVPDYDDDTLCLDNDVRIISGTLTYDDGAPVSGALISVVGPPALDGVISYAAFGGTASRGKFTVRFADADEGPVSVRVELDQCEFQYPPKRFHGDTTTTIPFDDGIADIQITVPSEICRRIEGTVVGPDGVGLSNAEVGFSSSWGARDPSSAASDGSFASRVRPGRYSVYIGLGEGCVIWFAGGDNVAAFRFDVGYSSLDDLDGIRVVVPENACLWSVRGRLVDSDGTGVADRWVSLQADRTIGGVVSRTGPDGSFEFVVPLPGGYRLSFELPDCWQKSYYRGNGSVTFDRSEAALLALGTHNVSGLTVEVPDGACDDR